MFFQPLAILMFCLALGFLLGRVKLRYLPANSTLATLIIAIVINVLLREFDVLGNLSKGDAFFNFGELKSFGFVFFSFAIGYSAGPRFVDAIKSNGWLFFVRSAIRNGKMLSEKQLDEFKSGDVLQLAGLAKSIDSFVSAHGYKREDRAPADLFSVTFILGIAITLGAISIFGISIGSGCCALLLGLCLGWVNKLRPDIAHIPSSSLTLLRSLGLNLFIASVALNAELIPDEVFSFKTLTYFGCSTLILAIPIIGTFLAARYMLHLSAVETLGGLCGCGTCTPALNALEEETGSSVFTAAYTIPYVIGNILLTIMGSIVVEFVR